MPTRRFISKSIFSSQPTKTFASTRCPSTAIHTEAWGLLAIVVALNVSKLIPLDNDCLSLATNVNHSLCGASIHGKFFRIFLIFVRFFLFFSFDTQRPLFDHLEEGGSGLRPYCDLLPGGKFGFFFQQMQNLYFYMLMLSNNNSIDERTVRKLNVAQPFDDFSRHSNFPP